MHIFGVVWMMLSVLPSKSGSVHINQHTLSMLLLRQHSEWHVQALMEMLLCCSRLFPLYEVEVVELMTLLQLSKINIIFKFVYLIVIYSSFIMLIDKKALVIAICQLAMHFKWINFFLKHFYHVYPTYTVPNAATYCYKNLNCAENLQHLLLFADANDTRYIDILSLVTVKKPNTWFQQW